MLDTVGEDDSAAHAVAQHDPGEPGVLGGGDADEGVEVCGVLGDVAQVHPLAAGPAVTPVIQRVGDQPGFAEPRRDVVVAAGVLGVPVGEDHHPTSGVPVPSGGVAGCPSGVHTSYTIRTPPIPSKLRSLWVTGIHGDYPAGLGTRRRRCCLRPVVVAGPVGGTA